MSWRAALKVYTANGQTAGTNGSPLIAIGAIMTPMLRSNSLPGSTQLFGVYACALQCLDSRPERRWAEMEYKPIGNRAGSAAFADTGPRHAKRLGTRVVCGSRNSRLERPQGVQDRRLLDSGRAYSADWSLDTPS